jgi:1-acyl-sn-glycerol-3-phosphate acyltransferase
VSLTTKTNIIVNGAENLSKKNSYLLISNHQGFLDILILQVTLDRYLPQLRYFIKQRLLWVPILGQACYVLGYPFMKRYSKKQLAKNPENRNKDIETTRKTCERFANTPITLINYVEGTRFTEQKKRFF